MKLYEALRLPIGTPKIQEKERNEPICLVMVGAGGKTSGLFHLAHELLSVGYYQTVLLTTTTHLGSDQVRHANAHIIVTDVDQLNRNLLALPPGIVIISGPEKDGRVAGMDRELLDYLHFYAVEIGIPLLIEGDGSRQRPLKAPAEHEPVIPAWVNHVIVVAGLSGLGHPLNDKWVHRPELFSRLSGLQIGETITPQALVRVLLHPEGGLKNTQSLVRKRVLLNQVTSPSLEAIAGGIVKELISAYESCILADIPYLGERCSSPVRAVHENVAGIILAAGGSERLGKPKQLLPWKGEPLIRHVAHTALQAGLSPIIVVTGAASNAIQSALANLSIQVVNNPDWRLGLSTSVVAGLKALPENTGAAIFLLTDQPQIPLTLLRNLIQVHSQSLSALVAPQVFGQRANPVLFDRRTFSDLLQLTGDQGGRTLFSRYPVTWVPWLDENILLDVDTLEDYERLGKLGK